MPPKPKYEKNQIIDAAYEMTRESGIDSVVARAVGQRLGTSSSPIFTVYSSMDEVRVDVRKLAKKKFLEYMDGLFLYDPAFMEFGMRWVRFAVEEPNLYRLLFLNGEHEKESYLNIVKEFGTIFDQMTEGLKKEFVLSEKDSGDLINQMLIHANGLATFYISNLGKFSEKLVSRSLNDMCVGIVCAMKLRDGTFDEEQAREFALKALEGSKPKRVRRKVN